MTTNAANILMIGMILMPVLLDILINVEMIVGQVNVQTMEENVNFIKDIKKALNTQDLWLKILSTLAMIIIMDLMISCFHLDASRKKPTCFTIKTLMVFLV